MPDLVEPEKHARAFGIFYTGTIGSGALAPLLYGFAGDAFGIDGAIMLVAALVFVTIPLALILRPLLPRTT